MVLLIFILPTRIPRSPTFFFGLISRAGLVQSRRGWYRQLPACHVLEVAQPAHALLQELLVVVQQIVVLEEIAGCRCWSCHSSGSLSMFIAKLDDIGNFFCRGEAGLVYSF